MTGVESSPTSVVIIRQDAGCAATTPTAGVLMKAAIESLVVEMLSPVLPVAVTAAFAARVKPEQVTVTCPAGRLDPELKLILT